MVAEIAHISQALVAALSEAHALVRSGTFGADLVDLVRHVREVGELLREAVERAGHEVDAPTRAMADTLAAAVESLDAQIQRKARHH